MVIKVVIANKISMSVLEHVHLTNVTHIQNVLILLMASNVNVDLRYDIIICIKQDKPCSAENPRKQVKIEVFQARTLLHCHLANVFIGK